jgi:hypothetical protein
MQRQPVDELPQSSPSIMEQRPDLRLKQSRDKRPAGATSRPIALAWIIQIVDSPVRVRIPRGLRPIVLQEPDPLFCKSYVTNRSTATLSSTPAHGIASMLVRDVRSCLVGCYSRAATLSCVIVSKSLASWRSCNCSEGSPKARFTIRPRLTAGRSPIASAQRRTCR